jgi:hypothetical protein
MTLLGSRYTRDRTRLSLALSFLGRGARTRTVHRWTGFSMDQVRNLWKYLQGASSVSMTPRRGKTPYQPGFFFRSGRTQSEAAILAGLFRVFSVVPDHSPNDPDQQLPSVARGLRLYSAYAIFTAAVATTSISLEHAILLLIELTRRVEMTLDQCEECDILILRDQLALSGRLCQWCQYERGRTLRERSRAGSSAHDAFSEGAVSDVDEPVQGSLF